MSKAFLWFGLLLSCFFLFRFTMSTTAKPLAYVFWIVILIGCVYKLFLAKPKAS